MMDRQQGKESPAVDREFILAGSLIILEGDFLLIVILLIVI